ncbi:hypothetical protein MOUN0_O08438 [Monosporozyma unispora]|nr:Genetic interactor of prohibitin 7, mitochondrial [Kazachstania unispora]
MLRLIPVIERSTRTHYTCILRNTSSSSCQVPKYSKGEVPKSLLLRQEQRLNTYDKKSLGDENVMGSAMTDVFNLFKPNAISREDEELTAKENERKISKFIKSVDFNTLLESKFQLTKPSHMLNRDCILHNFKLLTPFEYDVIHKFVTDSDTCLKDWKSLPQYTKQLQYFMAYGPIGPRTGLPFNKSPFIEIKPSKDTLSRIIIAAFLLASSLGFVKYKFTTEDDNTK